MNAKRQTIWLVSMLSLMVVLSAYYLFTEDSGSVDLTTASGSVSSTTTKPVAIDLKDPNGAKLDNSGDVAKVEVKPDPNQLAAASGAKNGTAATGDKGATPDAKVAATDTKATDTKAIADTKATSATGTDAKATDKATSGQAAASKTTAQATDAQVLDKMTSAALSGNDYFIDQQMKREEDISKKTETLMGITADAKQSTQDVEKAYNDLEKLQTMSTNMVNLEDKLKADYPNAVVSQEGDKFKVTVEADKLQASQAVSIIDATMKEMNVAQDKVIVQYVP
jgi:stage III sporulation protein AH